MKKYLSLIFAAVLLIGSLSACTAGTETGSKKTDKIQIVTTIFPEYDWVMNILGSDSNRADVTMLLDKGVDLHSFQPTASDILKVSTCDLFIYVGGESDEWVEDTLKQATNQDMIVINLLEVLGDAVKEEELVEGMQEDHDHEDDEEHDHDEEAEDHDHEEEYDHHHEEGETEYDEHVWLSLKNAEVIVKNISDAVQKLDPDHADSYKANTEAYTRKLSDLDSKYQEAVSGASQTTILFGDRFPFRYLVDDYNLSYYAAFVGCSAESEASFETISFLSKKVDELSLPAVMTIEGNDHRIAETIVQNTKTKDQKILSMDSMQSTTSKDAESGTSYLSVMEQNLSVLKEAIK